jgi:hypothetical protein
VPMHYELIDGIVRSTPTGSVSGNDMVEHIKDLLADKAIPSILIEVIDTSQVSDPLPGTNDAIKAASFAKALLSRFTAVHTIVVATIPSTFGLARMFIAYHERVTPGAKWHIVKSQGEVQGIIDSILGTDKLNS